VNITAPVTTAMAKAAHVHGSASRQTSVMMQSRGEPEEAQVDHRDHAEHDGNRGDMEHVERTEGEPRLHDEQRQRRRFEIVQQRQ
jgi:hypothetical protein